ncbi:MAG: hypothetical protein RMK84_19890 [Oscillochloridaceae bacterium]|nr:hypothetical protein [Chloroflexaceae bacterium]MDW8392383.1 hypothetical protein [Oscillochloridaceae bacterium]
MLVSEYATIPHLLRRFEAVPPLRPDRRATDRGVDERSGWKGVAENIANSSLRAIPRA